MHNSSPLLQLVGGSLQLGEQEVVQAGIAVEELSTCDGPPCRLSLSCTRIVSLRDCMSMIQNEVVANVQGQSLPVSVVSHYGMSLCLFVFGRQVLQ